MMKPHHRCKFCWHGNSSPTLSHGSISEHNTSSPKLVRSSTKFSCFASTQSLSCHDSPFIQHPLVATNNNYILPSEVSALNNHCDVISLCHILQKPLLQDFVILNKSVKSTTGRTQTFNREFCQRLAAMLIEKKTCERTNSKDSGLGSMSFDNVITQGDIDHPDFTGWLYDVNTKQRRWCVLADMLFCVFADQNDNVPIKVVLVSGSRIIRVLFSSAKRDALDPLRSLDIKVIQATPDLTISGQLKYQFVIDDCFTNRECSFAAESETLLDRWILMLKLASNLDMDVFYDAPPAIKQRQHDVTPKGNELLYSSHNVIKPASSHDVIKPEASHKSLGPALDQSITKSLSESHKRLFRSFSSHLVGYIPTTHKNEHRLSRHNSISCMFTNCRDSDNNAMEFENAKGPAFAKVIRQEVTASEDDDLSENISNEIDHVSMATKPVKKAVKLQRQGSYEAFKELVKRRTIVRALSDQGPTMDDLTHQETNDDNLQPSLDMASENDFLSSSLPTSRSELPLTHAYSTSMDYSSTPKQSQRLTIKASTLRGKFRGGKKHRSIKTRLYDVLTKESRVHGELYHKQVLKWSRVWCIVANGYFFVFRRQDDRSPMIQLPLVDCCVNAVDREKFSRDRVFKLCQLNARGLYFQGAEASFDMWLAMLKEETNTYQSFQRLSPRLSDQLDSEAESFERLNYFGETVNLDDEEDLSDQTDLFKIDEGINHERSVCKEQSLKSTSIEETNPQQTNPQQTKFTKNTESDQDPNITFDMANFIPSIQLSPPLSECGFSCWTLDNYFRRVHLNRENLTDSCDSLDSWDSNSTITEAEIIDQSASMEEMDSTSRSMMFQFALDDDIGDEGRDYVDYLDQERSIFNRHLPGPNNEGLLLLEDKTGFEENRISASTPEAELQHVRRASLSDNNLASEHHPLGSRPSRFRRSLSLTKSLKKHKKTDIRQLIPVNIAARNLDQPQAQGYLEICSRDIPWQSEWCVLKGTTLYFYMSPIEEDAIDSIDLERCSFRQCPAPYRDKLYVVEIKHLRHSADYVAMETEADMEAWFSHLQAARQEVAVAMETEHKDLPLPESIEVPPAESCSENTSLNSGAVCVDENIQRELVQQKKQQLLQELLLNKEQLQKQISRSSKEFDNDSPTESHRSPVSPRSLEVSMETSPSPEQADSDQETWKELCKLKQRKMSTELKMESLLRVLTTTNQPKQRKKTKVRLPVDLLRNKSISADTCLRSSEEVQHWEHQLELLKHDHDIIVGEIEERQARHSWSQLADSCPTPTQTSLVNNNEGALHETVDCTTNKSNSSRVEGNMHSTSPNKTKLEIRLSTSSAGNTSVKSQGSKSCSPGTQMSNTNHPVTKQTRLQKITKKFPNLPSLIPRLSLLRRPGNQDGQTGQRNSRRSSLDCGKPARNHRKRISMDECLVTNLKCYDRSVHLHDDVVLEDPVAVLPNIPSPIPDFEQVVPPNSRRSSGGTPPPDGNDSHGECVSSPQVPLSPSSDSILSSVLVALNRYSNEPSVENLAHDICSAHGDIQAAEQEATIPPPDMFSEGSPIGSPDCITPTSTGTNLSKEMPRLLLETNTQGTEQSLDIDTRHGSPMMHVGQLKVNINKTVTVRIDHLPGGSTKPVIKPETLAVIASFEALIQERLGAWPIM